MENLGLLHAYLENSGDEEAKNIIKIDHEVSSTEKSEYDHHMRAVREAVSSLHIADAVYSNRNELLKRIVDLGCGFSEGKIDLNDGFHDILFEFSRLLLNLCSAFYGFLEHHRTYFSRAYGTQSSEYFQWQQLVHETADNYFGHSLLFDLRRHIQHVDMPELTISLSKNTSDETTLYLAINREKLRDQYESWSQVSDEYLNTSGSDISVLTLLNNWDEAFSKLVYKSRELRVLKARPNAEYILGMRSHYHIPCGGKIGFCDMEKVKKADGSLNLNIGWIEENLADEVLEACEKNNS